MAGKKPAKPIAGQSRQVIQDPAIFGQLVKFQGFAGSGATCGCCSRVVIKGMVRIKNDNYYCSAGCAKIS